VDALEVVQKLAQRARKEEIPVFDVADRVLRRITSEEEETFGFLVFDLFASISALVASVVGYFSVGVLKFTTSPLMQFFAPLQEIRLW
jgi:hypothetical protein